MPEIQIAAPADFAFDRTVRSHGWFDLPPFSYDRDGGTLAFAYIDDATESVVSVTVRAAPRGLVASVSAGGAKARRAAATSCAPCCGSIRISRRCAPRSRARPSSLACVDAGGGRLMRAPTVFEDVVKMLCTTNCSWGLTRVMVERLVDKAGARGPGGARAFPTAAALAKKPLAFFRDVVRAGYRAPFLKAARDPRRERRARARGRCAARRSPRMTSTRACGRSRASAPTPPTTSCACSATTIGSGSTRGAARGYLKLYPRTRKATLDAAIARRYRPYAPHSGLAMWLDLTRTWHEPEAAFP